MVVKSSAGCCIFFCFCTGTGVVDYSNFRDINRDENEIDNGRIVYGH